MGKIKDIITSPEWTLSFEVFPPRDENREEILNKIGTIALQATILGNSYISVTHRLGTTFENTIETCRHIKKVAPKLPVCAHMTTVGLTEEQLAYNLGLCKGAGVDAILALRGDFPDDYDVSKATYRSSVDLIKAIKSMSDIEVGATWYPEGYDGSSMLAQVAFSSEKITAGAEFLISQMVFDSDIMVTDRRGALSFINTTVPFVPAVLPVTSLSAYDRCIKSYVSFPGDIAKKFNDPNVDVHKFGELYYKCLIMDMFKSGEKHVHLYTMNRPVLNRAVIEDFACCLKV